jgi:hypothetical protein
VNLEYKLYILTYIGHNSSHQSNRNSFGGNLKYSQFHWDRIQVDSLYILLVNLLQYMLNTLHHMKHMLLFVKNYLDNMKDI